MARYKQDHRETLQFITGSLDLMLPQDSVARAIWAGLERLDFSEHDRHYSNDVKGRSAINPRSLTGVWILAMLRGVDSSVRLAYLCGQDIEFRWMLGDAVVEKSTLCDFRKNHMEAVLALSTQVLSALGRNGLLPGENMGVDGTVVRAASSRHSVRRRKDLERTSNRLEEVLREKLSRTDGDTAPEEIKALEKRRKRLARALDEMDARGLTQPDDRLTITEPDAPLMRQKDGSFAPGVNAQVVTDLDTGVIIHVQTVDTGGDGGQLEPQIMAACGVLTDLGQAPKEPGCRSIAADGAYHDARQMNALENHGMRCNITDIRNTGRTAPGVSPQYAAGHFSYDEQTDTMTCPMGQPLRPRKINSDGTSMSYQAKAASCQTCPAKPECCPKSKEGRYVNRSLYIDLLKTVADRLKTEEGRRMRRARSVTCEGVFARISGLLHWKRCRMWGKKGAQAELLWRQLIHNLMLLEKVWEPLVLSVG